MTSGLFNTGETGDSAEITSQSLAVPPQVSDAKSNGFASSADVLEPSFDLTMFGDLGAGFGDSLADASLDSYTDLTSFLPEIPFLDEGVDKTETSAADKPVFEFSSVMKSKKTSLKRSFDEMETSSDLAQLSANVGLSNTTSFDHDYSTKRPKLSSVAETLSVKDMDEDDDFVAPSPAPSTSSMFDDVHEDKYRNRREKNNIASKRSRESRKQKFVNMEQEAERLIVDNTRLEQRIVELEDLAKRMKEILVAKMAGK